VLLCLNTLWTSFGKAVHQNIYSCVSVFWYHVLPLLVTITNMHNRIITSVSPSCMKASLSPSLDRRKGKRSHWIFRISQQGLCLPRIRQWRLWHVNISCLKQVTGTGLQTEVASVVTALGYGVYNRGTGVPSVAGRSHPVMSQLLSPAVTKPRRKADQSQWQS
jgi:hypothetical protein